MERKLRIYLNGQLLEADKGSLPLTDRGFLYGDGIFETVRLYGGKIFALERHLERMKRSAEFLGLPTPRLEWFGEAECLAVENGHQNGGARITLSRGSKPATVTPGETDSPTIFIKTRPLSAEIEERRNNGVKAVTLPWPLRAKGLPLQGHKTLAYLSSILALSKTSGGEEAIIETAEGFISEGATSNLFWVKEGKLHTPSLETGCLPGIIREIVLELAGGKGIETVEGEYLLSSLVSSDEAFITNSNLEIAPLVAIDGKPVCQGIPGEVTRTLQNEFADMVKKWRRAN